MEDIIQGPLLNQVCDNNGNLVALDHNDLDGVDLPDADSMYDDLILDDDDLFIPMEEEEEDHCYHLNQIPATTPTETTTTTSSRNINDRNMNHGSDVRMENLTNNSNVTVATRQGSNPQEKMEEEEPIMDGRMGPKTMTNPCANSNISDEITSSINNQHQNLDLSFDSESEHPQYDISTSSPSSIRIEEYILGTLIVRVAAGRDLKSVRKVNRRNLLFSSSTNNVSTNNRHSSNTSTKSWNGMRKRNVGISSNSSSRRRILDRGSSMMTSNPYAQISFGNQMQRTSTVYDTVNPSWPRTEQSFLDVSLPVPHLIQEDPDRDMTSNNPNSYGILKNDTNISVQCDPIQSLASPTSQTLPKLPKPPPPILTLSIFHTDVDHNAMDGKQSNKNLKPWKNKLSALSPSHDEDEFLGMASVDVTPLLTGKVSCIDRWFLLDGNDTMGNDGDVDGIGVAASVVESCGSVRLVIEYEAAECPPRRGDTVRFTGFIQPRDLFPLPTSKMFLVEDVVGDEIILSYYTKVENWKCEFHTHRYMVISVQRHTTALERYQDEVMELSQKLLISPAADAVQKAISDLPEEGILFLGLQAAVGSMSLMGRWMAGGVETAVEDIIYATNIDGQHTPQNHDSTSIVLRNVGDNTDLRLDDNISIDPSIDVSPIAKDDNDEDLSFGTTDLDDDTISVASNMPCCPISGQPMRDPVVAADGHTYEKKSILRWFRDSNISPLTGTALSHKELVPNFLLISTMSRKKGSESGVSSHITLC